MPQPPTHPYISSTDAAKRFKLTNDYIGALCRRGKVKGVLLGRLWYVDETSLAAYLESMRAKRTQQGQSLSKQWQKAWAVSILLALCIAAPHRAAAYDTTEASALNLSFLQYLPQTIGETSAELYDATFGAAARAWVAGVYAFGDWQMAEYKHLGLAFVDAIGTTPAQPQLSAAVVNAQPAQSNVFAVAVSTSTFPQADAAQNTAPVASVAPTSVVTTATTAQTFGAESSQQQYVTQAMLDSQIAALTSTIEELMASRPSTSFVSPQIAANGNGVYYGAAPAPVTTIDSSSVHLTLTAKDIPALNYFPATSTISIAYGGTGTSTVPAYGQVLLGNANGGYDLVATSSLGISVSGGGGGGTSFGYLFPSNATTTQLAFNGGLTITGAATTTGALVFTDTGLNRTFVNYGNTPFITASSSANNISIGLGALTSVTSGGNNVGLGANALAAITTGGDNVALGNGVFQYASDPTTGRNVGIGTGALQYAGGGSNVAVGYGDLRFATGLGNTALGYNAGNSIGGGSYNILVGSFENTGGSVIGGTNNILIGHDIGLTATTSGNQLDIQNILFGTNNGTTGTGGLSSGQIGIGTSSPFARFAIQANSSDTNTTLFAIGSSTSNSTTTLFSINNTGDISIDSTGSTLNHTLTFNNTGSATISAPVGNIYLQAGSCCGTVYLQNGGGAVELGSGGTVFVGAGWAGAGNNPKFQQYGYVTAASASKYVQWQLASNGDYELTRQDTSINKLDVQIPATFTGSTVGVGTSSPFAKLSVAANNGDTNTTLFAIGSSTSNSTTTLFSVSNTGVVNFNPAQNAGDKLGLYNGNLFIAASSTAQTAAIGQGALAANVAGVNLTAFGYGALGIATNTRSDTAVGAGALGALSTSGGGSTYTSNTAVGAGAFDALVWGQENVAVGASAGHGITSGLDNVAIGYRPLFASNTGSQNVAIGSYALLNFGSGINNIALGFDAGYSLTSGTGNIFLGTNVDAPNTTGSKQLDIGNLLYGTGIYDGSGGLSSAPVANGALGVGTSSPFAKFSIAANNGDTNTTLFAIGSSTASATSSLLTFDNMGRLAIGPNISPVSSSTQLSLLEGSTTVTEIAKATLNSKGVGVAVQGRYAYVVDQGSATNGLEVWDVSNPAAPVRIASKTLNQIGMSIYIQGHYAYLLDQFTSNGFEIWDISNPASPVRVGQSNVAVGSGTIYVQGRYAYLAEVGTSNAFEIFDVSNPAAPVRVSQSSLAQMGIGLYVQGRYAYFTDLISGALEIWDVSNPAAPTRVGQGTLNQSGGAIAVQGRYAYLADDGAANGFEVWDVSNPAVPVRVGQASLAFAAGAIVVQGRYAYVAEAMTNGPLEIWDISNPTAPARVAVKNMSGTGGFTNSLFVQGRYAYLANDVITNGFEVFDLGGAYVQQLESGGIETGSLDVNNLLAAADGSFSGGLTVGRSLDVNGPGNFVSAASTLNTTSNIFSVTTAGSSNSILSALGNGNVGMGTTTPFANLSVQANNGDTKKILFAIGSSTANATTTLFSVGNTGTLNVNLDTSTTTILTFGGQGLLSVSNSLQTVALGQGALTNNAAGFYNTAVGALSLANNVGNVSTGSYNSAFGGVALQQNINGAKNSAFGEGALQFNLNGNNNSAFGYEAGSQLLNSNNALFGAEALGFAASADYDTIIGTNAGAFMGAATSSTLIGYSSGDSFSGPSVVGLTAVGYQTFLSLQTGAKFDTALGYQAGYNITTGYGNILLGSDVANTSDLTSGSNNIGIGNDLQFASGSGNSQLNIGGILFGSLPATSTTFRLPTSGTIGVGTSSPFAKFAIQSNNGDTNTTLFAIGSSTSNSTTTLFTVDNTGNTTVTGALGVGVAANPQAYEMIVNGDISATGFYDRNAGGEFVDPTGNWQGFSAILAQNVGIGTTTAFGDKLVVNAAFGDTNSNLFVISSSTTSGTNQFFSINNMGVVALNPVAQTGDLVATFAGTSFVTASSTASNTSVGFNALHVDTTGGSNSAFGAYALVGNSSGSSDNAFGSWSLGANISGSDNNALGYAALRSNSNGSQNNSIGTAALYGNTSGSGNNALGYFALYLNNTSNYNVALGQSAGRTLVSGTGYNTFLGTGSDVSPSASTTLTNATAVGASVLLTTSNTVVLGSNANVGAGTSSPFAKFSIAANNGDTNTTLFAIGSSTASATTTLFSMSNTGNAYFAGKVGIGTQSPSFALHVLVATSTNPTPTDVAALEVSGTSGTAGAGPALLFKDPAPPPGVSVQYMGRIASVYETSGSNNLSGLAFYTNGTADATGDNLQERMRISNAGNVGIGTSSPYTRLTVWGTDAASSTLAFNIVNNASTTVFAVFDGGNAQLSGTLTQSSDRRLKTNITTLDASSSLSDIEALNPVTYNWIDPEKGSTTQFGFIAQDVQKIFPDLVSTTSATALTPDGTLGLNYMGLISPLVRAVQTLVGEVNNLASVVAGFAESFTSKQITATEQLCVADDSGNKTCVTKAQLDTLLQMAGQQSAPSSAPAASDTAPAPAPISDTASSTATTTDATAPTDSASSTPPADTATPADTTTAPASTQSTTDTATTTAPATQ